MALTTINSSGIKDDSIVNADIKSDAAIALSKLASTPAVLTGSTNNTVCTITGANAIAGEASLTFDAGLLKIDDLSGTAGKGRLEFGNSGEQYIEGFDTGNGGSSSYLSFGDGSAEYLRVDNLGNLGIGVSPSKKLHVQGLDVALRLESTAATGRIGMEFYDTSAQKGFFGYPSSGNDHMAIQQNEAADLYFYVNGADRLRIDSSGRIAHHNSNIVTNGFGYHGWTGKTQILDSQGLAVFRADDAWGGSLQLASSRGNYASPSASLAGDRVGGIYFCAHDGTDLNNYTSAIESYVTGTVASNATPGYLAFSTVNNSTNVLTERVRIQNGGGISFNGETAAANALNDYERGSYTPTCDAWGSFTAQYGYYVIIGDQVTAWGFIEDPSSTTSGSALQIGLPVASSGNTFGQGGSGGIMTENVNLSGGNETVTYVLQGQAKMRLYHITDSGWSTVNGNHCGSTSAIYFSVTYYTS